MEAMIMLETNLVRAETFLLFGVIPQTTERTCLPGCNLPRITCHKGLSATFLSYIS
jgi:hypothetical protein